MSNRELHDMSLGGIENLNDIEEKAKLEQELNEQKQKNKKLDNLLKDKKEFQKLEEVV